MSTTMKIILITFAALAVGQCANLAPKEPIPILHQEQEVNYDGSYKSYYETGNGIIAEEHGELTNPGTKDEAEKVVGFVSYNASDGTLIQYNYTADKDGFHVQGEHLPKSPEVPAVIVRSVEYNNAHPEEYEDNQQEEDQDKHEESEH